MSTQPERQSTKSDLSHWYLQRDEHNHLVAVRCDAKLWGKRHAVIDHPVGRSGKVITRRRVSIFNLCPSELQAWQQRKEICLATIEDAEAELELQKADLPQIIAAIAKAEGR